MEIDQKIEYKLLRGKVLFDSNNQGDNIIKYNQNCLRRDKDSVNEKFKEIFLKKYSSIKLEDSLMVCGGIRNKSSTKQCFMIDLDENKYERLEDMNRERCSFPMVCFRQHIYVFGSSDCK